LSAELAGLHSGDWVGSDHKVSKEQTGKREDSALIASEVGIAHKWAKETDLTYARAFRKRNLN
jgi:hypothetical protein